MGEEIPGELRSLAVDPKTYASLRRFRCGPGTARAEKEVHKIVAEYRKGQRHATAFRVTIQATGGDLVGVAAFHPGKFKNPILAQFDGFPYISVVGVASQHQKKRMGDVVMADALGEIRKRWPGKPVFALVDPNNDKSCKLFGRHDFDEVIKADPNNPEDDSLYGRRPMHDAKVLILSLLTPLGDDGIDADELSDRLAAASLGGEIAMNARRALRQEGVIESWKPTDEDGSEADRRWRIAARQAPGGDV